MHSIPGLQHQPPNRLRFGLHRDSGTPHPEGSAGPASFAEAFDLKRPIVVPASFAGDSDQPEAFGPGAVSYSRSFEGQLWLNSIPLKTKWPFELVGAVAVQVGKAFG